MKIGSRTKYYGQVRLSLMFIGVLALSGCGVPDSVIWEIDNLDKIGDHSVTVSGNPEVVETDIGKAVKFDGDGDLLLVDNNPIGDASSFTVEVVFKQKASYPDNIAPRFIHIMDPGDGDRKRLMIELRVNGQNRCYLDAFLQTDTAKLALIDSNLVHPTGQWLHAAVVYQEGVLTTYINGIKELSGTVGYEHTVINPVGKVAIGGRMNHVAWFNGLVKTIKVTRSALEPEDFMRLDD